MDVRSERVASVVGVSLGPRFYYMPKKKAEPGVYFILAASLVCDKSSCRYMAQSGMHSIYSSWTQLQPRPPFLLTWSGSHTCGRDSGDVSLLACFPAPG